MWPPEAFAYNGATEHMPDGRLIFRGPRVAMAIHETEDFECGLCFEHHSFVPTHLQLGDYQTAEAGGNVFCVAPSCARSCQLDIARHCMLSRSRAISQHPLHSLCEGSTPETALDSS